MRHYIGSPPFQWQGEINRESEQAGGLINWWPLDGNANEMIAKQNGTIYGALGAASVWGGTVRFDGVDDYIGIVGAAGLSGLQTGTISLWAKWSGTQDGGYGNTQFGHAFGVQRDGSYSQQIIALSTNNPATAKVVWCAYAYNPADITSVTTVGEDTWRHVVVAYRTGSHTLYLDGKFEATHPAGGTMLSDSSAVLGIGAWPGGGAGFMAGQLKDVRVYSRVLSAAEIWKLYDPQTRWELYQSPRPMVWWKPPTTSIIPRIRHHMAQQGMA